MPDLRLHVNNLAYGGWQEIRIQRGIRRFADTFDVKLTDRWAGQDQAVPILPDSECQVRIDDELVITGFVDDVAQDYDASQRSLSINGRSRLGDLVDCLGLQRQWNVPMKLERLAQDLLQSFGIKVVVESDTGATFKNPHIDTFESPQEFLSRMAQFRGVHLTSNAEGNLVITRAGTERIDTALVLGENVLRASSNQSKRDRFYKYIVTGQDQTDNDTWGSAATEVSGTAYDKAIRKTRVCYVDPGDRINLHDAGKIAQYERNIRYGESKTCNYTVNGWRHDDGLWTPNKRVKVIDHFLQLDEELLITHVNFIMDNRGQRTELELMPPEALDLIALPEPEQEGASW